MIDLSTNYLGMTLKSPVIVGSSGLTRSIENLKAIEKSGAGAVVLKSLFEEQISFESHKVMAHDDMQNAYTEAYDYIHNYAQSHKLDEYLDFIHQAKSSINIPVIASINCVTASEWTSFAKKVQDAGADALELNIFALPADPDIMGSQYEKVYFDIIEKVKNEISIPISIKISYHFSGLAEMIKKLSWTGIKGLVLFNRFFSPDIDINDLKIKPINVYSTPEEISMPLRWIAIMSDKVKIDLCASTGVHDGNGVVKQILAGAKAVQVCSTLYKNGLGHLDLINKQIVSWMESRKYEKLSDFRGMMSYEKISHPAAYQRVQFMKHFSGIE
ncbi:MAG: dihydroorotate dehydrogenase-like protein [Ignavibacterium sp.]|nr:dihydroorotate dehydrogenase-like protein [Ignavibacterium sp.]